MLDCSVLFLILIGENTEEQMLVPNMLMRLERLFQQLVPRERRYDGICTHDYISDCMML